MVKIGFITCSDLSKFKVSKKNQFFTHDDQLACDFLSERGFHVEPVVWGSSVTSVIAQDFDLLIIRSPWDYSQNESTIEFFFMWLKALEEHQILVANNYDILHWNLDKHYLFELKEYGVKILPTEFLEPHDDLEKLYIALTKWDKFVIKPCISSGATDTFMLHAHNLDEFLPRLQQIRHQRSFMLQPFVEDICSQGEWSLVFLNNEYSHAVLKKPQAGQWLVQDELGGSVESLDPPHDVRVFSEEVWSKSQKFLHERLGPNASLLYGRVDILPGLFLGELELVEPELFFLERRLGQPNISALMRFCIGISRFLKLY